MKGPHRRASRDRICRRVVRSLFLVLSIFVIWAAEVAAQGEEIAGIRIEGNERTEESLIRSRFPLSIGDRYNPGLAREGLKDLYGLRLFSDIQLLRELRPDGRVELLLQVEERARIGSVRFMGNEEIGADDLADRILVTRGQLHDPATIASARREILIAYKEDGYPLAEVTILPTTSPDTSAVDITFRIDEGERVRLRDITFTGAEHFSTDKLRGKLETKQKGFLRSGRFKQDVFNEDMEKVASFYRDSGFRDAEVLGYDSSYSDDQRDMFIDVQVSEGPQYTLDMPTWEGNESISSDVIGRLMTWTPGDPYSETRIQDGSAAITEVYNEHGYLLGFRVQEEETVSDGHRAQIHYRISEGEPSRVGEIRIAGNSRTKERVIRRELMIYPGQVFRRSALMRSQREIFELRYFDDVQLNFYPKGDDSNDIDLEFTVVERSVGTAGAGMGFSSATGLTGFLQLGHPNLFGNGWNINIRGERGSRGSQYELSFTEPWFMDRPISVGGDIFDTRLSRIDYRYRTRGVGFTVGWPFPGIDYTRIFTTFRVQDVSITDLSSSLSERARESLLGAAGRTNSLRFRIYRNTTDNPFYPTAGTRTSWTSEFAGGVLGGTVDYQKHILDHRSYVKPFWIPVIMVRERLGFLLPYTAGADVPGYETFRLGGTVFNYLRGYDDYYVVPRDNIITDIFGDSRFPGGRYMMTLTAEYQFPIAHPLHGLLFMDMGNTWNDLNDVSLYDLKRGAGLGCRMEIPMLGILGFDYAYGFDRDQPDGPGWKAHLILGQSF